MVTKVDIKTADKLFSVIEELVNATGLSYQDTFQFFKETIKYGGEIEIDEKKLKKLYVFQKPTQGEWKKIESVKLDSFANLGYVLLYRNVPLFPYKKKK